MHPVEWLTTKQFNEIYPWPSKSALAAYIHRAEELGLTDAFMRVRRRVLVSPSRFFKLIELHYHPKNKK